MFLHFTHYDIECVEAAKDFIDADISKHHSIPDIAAHAGMSATKLKASFRQMFGMGIYHYQREQRLQKGKILLEETDKSIKEISRSLGYKYVNNFQIAFKKRFDITAYKLRKQRL
jgi:AraC family transcriptional regulator, transcriptional activator of the genes for pyochelin and ferripyochelin receptors